MLPSQTYPTPPPPHPAPTHPPPPPEKNRITPLILFLFARIAPLSLFVRPFSVHPFLFFSFFLSFCFLHWPMSKIITQYSCFVVNFYYSKIFTSCQIVCVHTHWIGSSFSKYLTIPYYSFGEHFISIFLYKGSIF